ncbi:MAG: hypothetical protein NXI19_17525, partial [Alphaproteobacteria bacterium]|nr:hypothetical protein [Alphaproteobacteria bacterium]
MIDPAAYDDAESRAYRASSSWRWRALMTASVLDHSSFPMRVRSILDLKPLLDAMDMMRFERHVRELGGLREDDLDLLATAMQRVALFYIQTFHDPNVVVPLNSLLSLLLT